MARFTRRQVLKHSAALPAFALVEPRSLGHILGANERIRVGVAGIHGRGGAHIGEFAKFKDVEIAALIDPDSSLFEPRRKYLRDREGRDPGCFQDIREALEDKNLDVVSVATTNQWHSLIAVWACQAGKDVYVEKPMSHNVFEGRKVVEAAAKYKRIVQHGTQQRSDAGRAREILAVRSGKYGKLQVAKGFCCKPRWSIGFKKAKDPPAHLDWDLWLGPAPEQPFHENLVHYNWHWFWDFGDGDTGNQGVHELDVARWGIAGGLHPKSVWSLGGRFGYEDQGQTPNTQLSVFDYGEALIVFETRGLVARDKNDPFPFKVGNEFHTTDGMIRDGWFYPKHAPDKPEKIEAPEARVTPGGSFGSFLECVRSRDAAAVNGPAEDGHYSSALCHLGNISYRLGEPAPFSKSSKAFGDNKQIYDSLQAIENNLTRGVGLKIEETMFRVGRVLKFDAATEQFIGEPKADELLTRPYRAPYVVPEKV